MKLIHGMKVTCEIMGVKITDAKISRSVDGRVYICQNERDGWNADDKLGYKYSWGIVNGSVSDLTDNRVTNLKLKIAKDISDIKSYEVGDILVDEDGDRRKVLGICGLVVILSAHDDFETVGWPRTTRELMKGGHNFEEPKDTIIGKELTKTIKGKRYKVVVKEEVENE